jgi:hypothetical protein
MTDSSAPGGVSGRGGLCPLCQGQWIDGRLAIPIVGSLRFVYRLGTNEVGTEVVARMCKDCGHLELRGRDPELISRAQAASANARPIQRWAFRTHRTSTVYRSRYGQEQAE